MDEGAFDWLLLGSPANVSYTTGYRSVAGDIFPSHLMAAMISATELILVVPAADVGAVTEHVPINRVEPFGTFFFESASPDPALATVA